MALNHTTEPARSTSSLPVDETPALSIRSLHKTYDKRGLAVENLSLDIHEGEVLCLLGPSGCGKTTTLRSIAGLERPDSGEITVGGRVVFSTQGRRAVSLPPERRNVSMVFQQYALWPHMDVIGNVTFGLRMRGMSRAAAAREGDNALRRVQLLAERSRRVGQLSGGQQQRVALARATAGSPSVILFDEPLSNLDARLRQEMRIELLELHRSLGFTALYVTHDQEEAFSISTRIAIMNRGTIEQIGRPEEIWENPASPFAAEFIGSTNRLTASWARTDGDVQLLEVDDSAMQLAVVGSQDPAAGGRVLAYVKLGDVEVLDDRPADLINVWEGEVELESYQGEFAMVKIRVAGVSLVSKQSGWTMRGTRRVFVRIPPGAVRTFAVAPSSDTENQE